MRKGTFYLNAQILSIYSGEHARGHMYVPAGALITIVLEDLSQDRLIDVLWNDQKLQMFAQDVRERADRVDVAAATSSQAARVA